jgi:hypothetical protein
MPRCERCNRMQPSVEVRKMPGRDAYRCKDKFGCELAETNREPFTAVIRTTFPAKDFAEAWEIVGDLPQAMHPWPTTIERILDQEEFVSYSKSEARKSKAAV